MNLRHKKDRTCRSVAVTIVQLLLLVSFPIEVSVKACLGVGIFSPNVLVRENEPFVRIGLYRERSDIVETVDYFTEDGFTEDGVFYGINNAKAGVHYVSRSGTATFPIGQKAISVDIPLIDNGRLDGFKDFSLAFANASPGLGLRPVWIRIVDNEISAAVDPLFVPDVPNPEFGGPGLLTPFSDGRVFVATQSRLPTMLQSNGWVDVKFNSNVAASFKTGSVTPWKALKDGRILVTVTETDNSQRLVRLSPDGNVETSFVLASDLSVVAPKMDGKFLATGRINHARVLRRLNSDGSLDASFSDLPFDSLFDSNDQILLVRSNVLTRLNADGRRDELFAPQPFEKQINNILARRNGAVLVQYATNLVQLNSDGSVDKHFRLDLAEMPEGIIPQFELEDGRLISEVSFASIQTSAIMWTSDGSLIPSFHPDIIGFNGCRAVGPHIGPVESGQILVAGPLETVDGFPRHGLARLLTNPPERDFRVVTPVEFQQSSENARIRIVRTGPTTNSATVSFSTHDDTAKAGEDYLSMSGAVNFAPLEVSKEVVIPLLATTAPQERRVFRLELSNPSDGYAKIPSTPVSILPDVHIVTDSLAPRSDGSVSLTLVGTVPGKTYFIEVSSDLEHWFKTRNPFQTASSPTTVFDPILGYDADSGIVIPSVGKVPRFYRAARF